MADIEVDIRCPDHGLLTRHPDVPTIRVTTSRQSVSLTVEATSDELAWQVQRVWREHVLQEHSDA